jgi:uncharacterized damage-inducible protein DinB
MPHRVGLLIVRSIRSRPRVRAALNACENALAWSWRGTREENIGHYLIMSSLAIRFDELLRYTASERDKWRMWLSLHPMAMDAAVQPGGRLPTVGKLVDHIFLVEQRHLQRLTRQPLSTSTGLTGNNVAPLFNYGASVRRELEQFVADLDPDVADEVRSFEVREKQWPMTSRKLLFHILVHEIRHWAQVALAVRLAGHEPPGDHDLLFSSALR